MSLPTADEVMNRYLYDASSTPSDLRDDSLIRESLAEGQAIQIAMSEYMVTGAGRFANAVMSSLTVNFFESTQSTLDGDGTRHEYSVQDMAALVGGEQSFSFQQYFFHDSNADDEYRTFIFGTSGFKISDDAVFVVDENGNRSIENFAIHAWDDNFDFLSSSIPTQLIDYFVAGPYLDPSGIGRTVDIEFTGKVDVQTSTYTTADYQADEDRYADQHSVSHWGQLASDLTSLVTGFNTSGTSRFVVPSDYVGGPDRAIFYGTTEDDTLTPAAIESQQ